MGMEHEARRSTLQQRTSMREVSRKLYSISESVCQILPKATCFSQHAFFKQQSTASRWIDVEPWKTGLTIL